MSQTSVIAIGVFVFWTLTSIGMIFDKSSFAWPNELVRSVIFLVLYVKFGALRNFLVPAQIMYSTFLASAAIAAIMTASMGFAKTTTQKKKVN